MVCMVAAFHLNANSVLCEQALGFTLQHTWHVDTSSWPTYLLLHPQA